MTPRIDAEVELIRNHFPTLVYKRNEGWVFIPDYGVFSGWNPELISVAIQINPSHPSARPYGFYVDSAITYKGQVPSNFKASPPASVPFEGNWGLFSWELEEWKPHEEIHKGSNLFNFVMTFAHRFHQGV